METRDQMWAYTNRLNSVGVWGMKDGYYVDDVGFIDAPDFVAGGSTKENIVHRPICDRWGKTGEETVERCVIGSLAERNEK